MFELTWLQVPTIELSRTMFIALNYLIVTMFVVMNVYITYQIIQSYGPALWSLFRGEQTDSSSTVDQSSSSLTPETRTTFGLVLMVIGGLLTASIVGMVYGIPLFMMGREMRQRVSEEREQEVVVT